jgi:hypothetical protein
VVGSEGIAMAKKYHTAELRMPWSWEQSQSLLMMPLVERMVEMGGGSSQDGGENLAAFWLVFTVLFCLPFRPNFTNCSNACIFA